MCVIVDTSVWSLALRRKSFVETSEVAQLRILVQKQAVQMLGCVRQELLSGIKEQAQFERLRDELRAFPDLTMREAIYELAAGMFNRCRAQGVQGSNTDFLICAAAQLENCPIFTVDQDFSHYQRVLGISLYTYG